MLKIPYRSRVTSRVSFEDEQGLPFDPVSVVLHLNDEQVSYPGDVVLETAGTYRHTWVADEPGLVARVWIGEAGEFYAETEREWFRVKDSNLV